jgi:hypothetical protein
MFHQGDFAMSNIYRPKTHTQTAVGQADFGAFTMLASLYGVMSLFVTFFTELYLALFVVLFAVVWAVLRGVADHRAPPEQRIRTFAEKLGAVCFNGALICVVLGAWPVLGLNAGYALVGWFATGLFAAGLALDVMAHLSAFFRLLGVAFTGAMAAALVLLPIPGGALPPDDGSRTWIVEVMVRDENNAPVRDAIANCAAVPVWDQTSPEVFRTGTGRFTDAEGRAEFSFSDDTRLTVAACLAFLPATSEAPGYKPRTAIALSPIPGARLHAEIRLSESTPPGSHCTDNAEISSRCATRADYGRYWLGAR